MTPLRFRPGSELWPLVDRAFQRHSREIRTLVPLAQVEHVGATAVPGSLTKGDVDLLVRVPGDGLAAAAGSLQARYVADQPENWTSTFASFLVDEPEDIPVGVQVVAAGSRIDSAFSALRRALRGRPELVERGNELKRRHEGGEPAPYAVAKRRYLEDILREADPEHFSAGTWPWAE